MSDRERLAARAREAGLAVAADRARRTAEPGRALAPGDLLIDRRTAALPVEWAVIDAERTAASGDRPGEGPEHSRLLLVPADSLPLRGPSDVAVGGDSQADPALGPLTLRCAHGVWIGADRLEPALRGGSLPESAVRAARARCRDLEAGSRPAGTPLEREAEADPEYRYWVESVLVPSREALAAAARATGPPPVPAPSPAGRAPDTRRRPFSPSWALAASVLLSAVLGLAAGQLRHRHETAELRAELAALREAESSLRGERERLTRLLTHADEEHRRELAERERAAAAAERGFQERLAALQTRLREALTPRALVGLPFETLVPDEPLRGDPEVVEIPADADHLGLLLEYAGTEPYPSYRLELRRQAGGPPLWVADRLVKNEALLSFALVLPSRLFEPGRHRLELYGLGEGGERERLAEYEMVVVFED